MMALCEYMELSLQIFMHFSFIKKVSQAIFNPWKVGSVMEGNRFLPALLIFGGDRWKIQWYILCCSICPTTLSVSAQRKLYLSQSINLAKQCTWALLKCRRRPYLEQGAKRSRLSLLPISIPEQSFGYFLSGMMAISCLVSVVYLFLIVQFKSTELIEAEI